MGRRGALSGSADMIAMFINMKDIPDAMKVHDNKILVGYSEVKSACAFLCLMMRAMAEIEQTFHVILDLPRL